MVKRRWLRVLLGMLAIVVIALAVLSIFLLPPALRIASGYLA